jgi:glycopeptide antibiotics resistance protein
MFIPTGILIPLLYRNRNSFLKTVLTGFWISLTIEILQLPFAVRCSDVDDLILNTAGCLVGYGIYALGKWIKKSIKTA